MKYEDTSGVSKIKIRVAKDNVIPLGSSYRLHNKYMDGIIKRKIASSLAYHGVVQQQSMYVSIKEFVKEMFNG